MSDHPEDPNVRHDAGGWISGPCLPEAETSLPPMIPPGTTGTRMVFRAAADALSLPAPHQEHDVHLRNANLSKRAAIVASVLRRLADDPEADSLDAAVAAAAITDRVADFPVNFSVHPMSS